MSGDDLIFQSFADGIEYCRFQNLKRDFPPHFHTHYVIGCLLNGDRRIAIGDQTQIIAPGQVAFIPPGVTHACDHTHGRSDAWSCIHLPSYHPYVKERLGSSAQITHSSEVYKLHILLDAQIQQKDGQWRQTLRRLISALPPPNRTDRSEKDHPDKDAIANLCNYLLGRPDAGLSLEDMSKIAGLNKFRLVRSFRQIMNITPARYQENLRINHARDLLLSGEKIRIAALDSGFFDQSHFVHRFKRNIGFPPAILCRHEIFSGDAE